MATSLISNLYPPIVPDAMPAFLRKNSCRIYFSLPSYNSFKDITNVQISLINQKTNAYALRSDTYPAGIKIANIQIDNENKYGDYGYFVEIFPSDLSKELEEQEFGLNQFYKVQLRFTSKECPETSPNKVDAAWLYKYRPYFS